METFEGERPNRWRMEDVPAAYIAAMIKGIVAYEMPIDTLDAKAKLSQNRVAADQEGAIAGLRSTGDAMDFDVARLMEEARTGW